jgi:ABC-2 type transport system ATP-binding protein
VSAAIVAEGLHKRFGGVEALRGVSFEVPEGTVLGVLGPNGAGKTTAVRILTTILRPDAGTATVLGVDVVADPEKVRASIGLAGQYAAVDENLTGRENLRLVARLTHQPSAEIPERCAELLEFFRLTDAADRPVRTYSGGMRRRLDLAASLVHRPPVLFLDEPTTGLDPASRNDLWAVIEGLVADGTTLLLTTQYLEEADRLADQIAVIDGGRVIADGTAQELKSSLGTTIVEAIFSDSDTASRAATLLAPIGHGQPAVVTTGVTLRVDDPTAALFAIVRTLDDANISPESLTVREPTLDDVFLELTGHTTETEDEP